MEYSTDNGWIVLGILSLLVFLIIMVPLLPGIIAVALLRRRVEKFLKQNTATVIAQYDPPQGFTPAQIGFLYDSICGEKEIRATLFELAQKNIIAISSDKAVTVIDSAAYEALPEYAKGAVRLFDKQTARTDKTYVTRTVTILDQNNQEQEVTLTVPIRQSVSTFTKAVQASLKDKGIATKSYYGEFWRRVFYVYVIIWALPWLGVIAFGIESNGTPQGSWSFGAITGGFWFAFVFGIFLFPIYFLASFLAVKLFVKIAGRVWLNTKQVRKLWPELEGYRQFLETVDLPRIQFESATSTTSNPVTDTLPYAMVFNLDTKWQERLKG